LTGGAFEYHIVDVVMQFTTDRNLLYGYFRKDPVLFGYHIGDLDEFYFKKCRWAVNLDGRGEIGESILIYNGPAVPTVLALGPGHHLDNLIEELLPLLPDRFYCHFHRELRSIFLRRFAGEPLGTHLKMKLESPASYRLSLSADRIARLDLSNKKELLELYDRSYPGNYFDVRMLKTGKYFGYFDGGRIIAVSGIHVYSDEYNIAVLGNIVTDPDHRNRGLATAVTSRLVDELAGEGKLVTLNVGASNYPAISCYRKLGFEKVHEYEESIFSARL
jgi:ribosomal protein S18 acetylase RimI-like enzyme